MVCSRYVSLYPTTYLDPSVSYPLSVLAATKYLAGPPHRLLCSRILRICGRVKKLDRDFLLTATTFPVYLALMAIFTGVFILTTILQKYEFD